jgi:DinB superfamily
MNDEFDRRLAAAAARLTTFGSVLGAGDWPLAARFDHAPEAAWGPREVLAHLAEMLPYWLGEAERIVDMTAGPEPFGRIATNDVRIGIIERDRSLPIRELVARIDDGVARWRRRWAELDEADRSRAGLHPALGEFTVDQVAGRMVATHLEDHLDQLTTSLASAAEAAAAAEADAAAG